MVNALWESLTRRDRGIEGLFIGHENAPLIEMAGLAGFRYVVLDGEHGALDGHLPDLLRTARLAGLGALVRVPLTQPSKMSQALDWGATGILVPGAQSTEDIEYAAAFCRYPPQGHRGLASMIPAARYGWPGESDAADLGPATKIFIQVETVGAMDRIEQWASRPEVDGFFIGPSDLSMALGEGGIMGVDTAAAIERVIAVLEAAGQVWGIFSPDAASRMRWTSRGAHLVATAVPMLLRSGVAAWRGGSLHA